MDSSISIIEFAKKQTEHKIYNQYHQKNTKTK
jgi:hypothetical protein